MKGGIALENQLICIVGPTASGKTALSVALAKQRNTEIISADSMQIYRGMDIGTAKPDVQERQGIVHHMFDICEPGEDFSVARYVECADRCAQQILQQGKIPIVVGGTGLYLDALIAGNDFSGEEADTTLRKELEQFAEQYGNEALHARLQAIDPVRAQQLHPNNRKRVIRAIEVFEQTGMTLDQLNQKNQRPAPKYRAVKIGLCPQSRETLYERINQRVDQMLEQGLLDEVRALISSGHFTGTAAQAIGYKEYIPFLEGTASLEECTQLLKQHSRNYAKRQLTWLKRDGEIHWIYYETGMGLDEVVRHSTEILASKGL